VSDSLTVGLFVSELISDFEIENHVLGGLIRDVIVIIGLVRIFSSAIFEYNRSRIE
jgi:hypothetical protein